MSTAKLAIIIAGVLSLLVAILHIAIVVAGAEWYRFFGAGEQMAKMAEQGSLIPAIVTLAIAIVFAVWAAYAFASAGIIANMPLQKTALIAISSIYILRGLVVVVLIFKPELASSFNIWSSLVSLAIGLLYAYGTWFLEF
ncbi:MAG TPA: hypothetical protein ENK21_01765 [Trueperaceae bacterium]|nr:hypothetical protein [Trueperaceae bacterium]